MSREISAMREWLTLQSRTPQALRLASLTRASTTATATTIAAHGYATGDYVTIAGATPTGYTGKVLITVTAPTTFTYAVADDLTTPATGILTATYVSNAQGGRRDDWVTVATVPAEALDVRASEVLQARAIQAQVDRKFRLRVRPDLSPTMRVLWTPSWPPNAGQLTLEVHGVVPYGDGRVYSVLICGEVAS